MAAVLPLLLGSSNCGHNKPIPVWNGKIYTGDHEQKALVRKQSGEVISADSPEFDQHMSMKWKGADGFQGFYETYVLGCEKWKANTPMVPLSLMMQKLEEAKSK